uniref:Uncharacterized protein n=1 Tax=Timema cristinae TaxID=61476 RepID=A0A7R9CE11_TIMCR|nr:unnamed protein product [Timema cristinae]
MVAEPYLCRVDGATDQKGFGGTVTPSPNLKELGAGGEGGRESVIIFRSAKLTPAGKGMIIVLSGSLGHKISSDLQAGDKANLLPDGSEEE